ncbi:MAG: DUF3034 family protein [Pseudomonadota bacterium]
MTCKLHSLPRTALALALCLPLGLAHAQPGDDEADLSGKLLLTGGVSQVEGSAGGGLTPWAVIGGYGTRDQIGANAYFTRVDVDDYSLDSYGVLVGLYDRVELSFSRQAFDTQAIGGALGLGNGFTFTQDTIGVKVKVAGDAVLEQDSWLPQISVGAQYKKNDQPGVLAFVGARDDSGVDYYVSATKLYLDKSLLLNTTLRLTKANQFGILGFGGDLNDDYEAQLEGSFAYLLSRNLAVGGEYRMKPDNLGIAEENDAWDVFVAWAPVKNVSLTLAYVDLGNIVIADNQRGVYASLQVGF